MEKRSIKAFAREAVFVLVVSLLLGLVPGSDVALLGSWSVRDVIVGLLLLETLSGFILFTIKMVEKDGVKESVAAVDKATDGLNTVRLLKAAVRFFWSAKADQAETLSVTLDPRKNESKS